MMKYNKTNVTIGTKTVNKLIKNRENQPPNGPESTKHLKKWYPGAFRTGSWNKVGSKSGVSEDRPSFLADFEDPQIPRGYPKATNKFNTATFWCPWAA